METETHSSGRLMTFVVFVRTSLWTLSHSPRSRRRLSLVESSPLRERLYPYRGVSIPRPYGINWDEYDKILVERVVLGNSDLPVTVLRLPMVFGPGARDAAQRRFFPYLKRMDDGARRSCWMCEPRDGEVRGVIRVTLEKLFD